MARNIKLVLEYDGTDFKGSQLQIPGQRTVQGELETALARLTGLKAGERCKVSLAGRTDTGVHASGQVANFQTESSLAIETFRRGLNALLPFDLVVHKASEVEADFHARFSAKLRRYRYRVVNHPVRSPLMRRFAHSVRDPLDLAAMQAAAHLLVGEHDFASFAGDGWGTRDSDEAADGPSTVRNLLEAKLDYWEPEARLVIELAANAFLPHMVRNIVGTLLLVGKGSLQPSQFEEILAAHDRRRAGPTAPACGLCLVEVSY